MLVRAVVLALYFASACYADAATITIMSLVPGQPAVVAVEGPFEQHDPEEFGKKVGLLSDAIITFNSTGGDLRAGIGIGETIWQKNFKTLVLGNAHCASACAIAWLGGTQRFISSGGRIGFHAAYDPATGQTSSAGNAVMGAYLHKIGLSYEAIVNVAKAPPNSITWLGADEAVQQGIQVSAVVYNLLERASTPRKHAPLAVIAKIALTSNTATLANTTRQRTITPNSVRTVT